MIGKLKDLLRLSGGEWLVSFTTRDDPRNIFDALKSFAVKVEIKRASKHRSLSANAYAWVLIGKISEKMKLKESEVYRNAIREIGGVWEIYGVREDAVESFTELWCKDHLGRQVQVIPGSSKPGWSNVRAWKGSSDFDSAQMSRFIDSLIQDAEAIGIPTVTPKEYEEMLGRWGEKRESVKPSTT